MSKKIKKIKDLNDLKEISSFIKDYKYTLDDPVKKVKFEKML